MVVKLNRAPTATPIKPLLIKATELGGGDTVQDRGAGDDEFSLVGLSSASLPSRISGKGTNSYPALNTVPQTSRIGTDGKGTVENGVPQTSLIGMDGDASKISLSGVDGHGAQSPLIGMAGTATLQTSLDGKVGSTTHTSLDGTAGNTPQTSLTGTAGLPPLCL